MWRSTVAGAGDGEAESRRKEEEGERGWGRGLARSHQPDLNGASRRRPSKRAVSVRARAHWPAWRLTGGPNRSALVSIRTKRAFSLFCNG